MFRYDYLGGYEHDMGGRPGYPDDRPRGRYGGRSSGGYQGGPSGKHQLIIKYNCSTKHIVCFWG